MSATIDRIVEEFRGLSLDEQQRLLERLEQETHASERARRAELSRQIRGKYRNVLSSTEEFMTRRARETAEEDRR
jgi:hypothetical protein